MKNIKDRKKKLFKRSIMLGLIIAAAVTVGIPMLLMGPYKGSLFYLNYIFPILFVIWAVLMLRLLYLLHKAKKSKYEYEFKK